MTRKKTVEEIVASLNIIDDTLFQKMAEDTGFCEELLTTVLQQKVIVEKVIPQNSIKNLQGRSVVLDALCVLEDGKRCNVEVQKANDDNHEKRVRYNTSCITANITDPGTRFEMVPNVIGIFISKFDMFKKGKTIYHVDRTVRETGDVVDNGLQEIYVNTKIDDGSDLAELMKIYKERSVFDYQKFPKTSKRKGQFIRNEGGKREMCELVENYARQVAEEEAAKAAVEAARKAEEATAKSLFENGADFELVHRSVKSLSKEELQFIYEEVQANN